MSDQEQQFQALRNSLREDGFTESFAGISIDGTIAHIQLPKVGPCVVCEGSPSLYAGKRTYSFDSSLVNFFKNKANKYDWIPEILYASDRYVIYKECVNYVSVEWSDFVTIARDSKAALTKFGKGDITLDQLTKGTRVTCKDHDYALTPLAKDIIKKMHTLQSNEVVKSVDPELQQAYDLFLAEVKKFTDVDKSGSLFKIATNNHLTITLTEIDTNTIVVQRDATGHIINWKVRDVYLFKTLIPTYVFVDDCKTNTNYVFELIKTTIDEGVTLENRLGIFCSTKDVGDGLTKWSFLDYVDDVVASV